MTEPRLLYGSDEIAVRVAELGKELSGRLRDGAVAVGVLKGCLPFMADLVRRIDRHLEIDFVALSAFAPDSGRIRLIRDLVSDVSGRQVLLIEGVVDTGFRLDFLRRHMLDHGPTRFWPAPCWTAQTVVFCPHGSTIRDSSPTRALSSGTASTITADTGTCPAWQQWT